MTMFPGEVPKKLPNTAYWQNSGFDFTSFRPMPSETDEPMKHIRLDKALEYLLGDKLK